MGAFHLAYTVSDLDSARKFYGDLLGCREGRSTESWVDFDFFGNQLSLHIGQTINEVKIETHYAKNTYFIEENQILLDIARVPDVPIYIIHGRKDLTCTLESSWELHQALPSSELKIVRDGGHLAGETPMVDALITASDHMAELLA